MAGVAGPLLRFDRAGGLRLLAGLLVGEIAAGALLSLPGYLVGTAVHDLVPAHARLWLLAVVCAVFAVADLANRTPHVWRQVPQSFARTLLPGERGLAWGFDLGTLFSTQKVTSLIWAAIAAGLLLSPAGTAAVIMTVTLVSGLVIAVQSFRYRPEGAIRRANLRLGRVWKRVRLGSGALLLTLLAMTVVQAWQS